MIADLGNNNKLIEFVPGAEPIVPDPTVPLTFTVVILKYQDRFVFLYNPERQQWETPGGGINPGESVYDCACREVWEETSQVVDRLTYKGLFKIQFEERFEYCALYAGEIEELKPFVPNNESERIVLAYTINELEEKFSTLSRALIDFC